MKQLPKTVKITSKLKKIYIKSINKQLKSCIGCRKMSKIDNLPLPFDLIARYNGYNPLYLQEQNGLQ